MAERTPNSRYIALAPVPGSHYVAKPAGVAVVERLAREGKGLISIAKALGISKDGFRELRKRQPEVQEAVDRGHAELGDELTDIFLEQARNGNTVAAIYLSKARLGWIEGKAPDAGQTNVQVNINMPPNMTDEQFAVLVDAPVTKLIGGGNAGD